MKYIKKLLIIILLICNGVFLYGCNESVGLVKADIFDVQEGFQISKDYLNYIKSGDINSANNLCSEDLLAKNTETNEGVSDITSFQKDTWVEGNNFAYYLYNVIRTSNVEPKSDLEGYTLKVEKVDNEYLITQVKAQSKKELFVRDRLLKIVEEEVGNSNLVVSLDSLPKDTYLGGNEMMLYKEKVPNNNFGKVGLSFTGKKIALSTEGNGNTYICIATIEDSVATVGSANDSSSQGSASTDITSQLEELFEKPIAKKIISLDLLNNSSINNYIFSTEEEYLAVNYTNENGSQSVNIYGTDDGSLVESGITDKFDISKYNIEGIEFENEIFYFKVSTIEESTTDDVAGEYKVDLDTETIEKL